MNLGIGLGLAFRPVIGGASAPPAKTYADFQTHIKAKATSGSRGFGSTIQPSAGKYWTTATAYVGAMAGSPYLANANPDFTEVSPFVRHALPSQVVFDAQVAAGRDLYFEQTSSAPAAVVGLARNGLTSTAQANNGTNVIGCPLAIWWDGTQALQYDPSTNTGPTPYPIP